MLLRGQGGVKSSSTSANFTFGVPFNVIAA